MQKTREKVSQRIMVLRRGVMRAFLVKSQARVQKSREMMTRLMGWRLMKKRERGERVGVPDVDFVFAKWKCFM